MTIQFLLEACPQTKGGPHRRKRLRTNEASADVAHVSLDIVTVLDGDTHVLQTRPWRPRPFATERERGSALQASRKQKQKARKRSRGIGAFVQTVLDQAIGKLNAAGVRVGGLRQNFLIVAPLKLYGDGVLPQVLSERDDSIF